MGLIKAGIGAVEASLPINGKNFSIVKRMKP